MLIAGVFQELIQLMLQQYEGPIGDFRDFLYTWEGLSPQGAITIFIVVRSVQRGPRAPSCAGAPHVSRRATIGASAWSGPGLRCCVLVLLPAVAGSYVGQVLMLVGLYILMGMGLIWRSAWPACSISALSRSSPSAPIPRRCSPPTRRTRWRTCCYWAAMPIAVLLSIMVGVLFGLPVLGVRGDYLAVATMGLGEIVRVIVQSDFAAPLLGGAQGILQIPKPRLGDFVLEQPGRRCST